MSLKRNKCLSWVCRPRVSCTHSSRMNTEFGLPKTLAGNPLSGGETGKIISLLEKKREVNELVLLMFSITPTGASFSFTNRCPQLLNITWTSKPVSQSYQFVIATSRSAAHCPRVQCSELYSAGDSHGNAEIILFSAVLRSLSSKDERIGPFSLPSTVFFPLPFVPLLLNFGVVEFQC